MFIEKFEIKFFLMQRVKIRIIYFLKQFSICRVKFAILDIIVFKEIKIVFNFFKFLQYFTIKLYLSV